MPIAARAVEPLGARAGRERAADDREVVVEMLPSAVPGREARVVGERAAPGDRGEERGEAALEVQRRLHEDRDLVAARDDERRRRCERALPVADEQPAEERLDHAHVEVRPPAVPAPGDERGEDPLRRGRAGEQVGEGERHGQPEPAGRAGQLEHPAEGLHRAVGRGQLRVRAVGPEPRDRAVHEARVGRAQVCVADRQPFGDARTEVLEQHVGPGGEVAQHAATRVGLQVEDDRPAVTVQRHVEGRWRVALREAGPGAGRVPAGRLDPHDVGAQVREGARRDRPGEERGEVEHPDAGERAGRVVRGHAGGHGRSLPGGHRPRHRPEPLVAGGGLTPR